MSSFIDYGYTYYMYLHAWRSIIAKYSINPSIHKRNSGVSETNLGKLVKLMGVLHVCKRAHDSATVDPVG